MLGLRATRVVAVAAALFGFSMACAAAATNKDDKFTASELLCQEISPDRKATLAVPEGQAMPSQGVVVRVSLHFADPKGAPTATLISNSGATAFADIVTQRTAAFRLDCLPKDEAPSALVGEVQFMPGQPPKAIESWRRARVPAASLKDCYAGVDGALLLPFPRPAGSTIRFKDEYGTLIAEWTFHGPDSPPSMKILFNNAGPKFESNVLEHGAGYRRPCQRADARPTVVQRVFRYVAADQQVEATPITLQQFLGAVDNLRERPARFDFTTMGCPFKARLTYYQPYAFNDVDEATASDANKREFVEWLSELTVKPSLNANNKLISREFDVAVPCLVLDLL